MKENYEIRLLRAKDVVAAVNIVRSSFEAAYLIPSVYRCKGIEKFIYFELDNPFSAYKHFVICKGNEIVGFAEFKLLKSTSVAFFNVIAISNKYKGLGLGKLLLEYSKNFFAEYGATAIQLDVYKSNLNAISYYDKFGFVKTDSKRFYKIQIPENSFEADICVLNFSQYKAMIEVFGFYFIDVIIDSTAARLGVIDSDIIIRGQYDLPLQNTIKTISNALFVNNVYLIADSCDSEGALIKDEIYRFQLIIR